MKRVLYLSILLLLAAGAAEAVTYLKSDDKVIMNDGTEMIGTVVFRSEKLVVVMVEGEERRIDMTEVKKIEMAEDVTGMVERRKGDEPPPKKKTEEGEPGEEKPEEKPEEKEQPKEKPEEKAPPAEKPEEKELPAEKQEDEAADEPEAEEPPGEAVEPAPRPVDVLEGRPRPKAPEPEEGTGGG